VNILFVNYGDFTTNSLNHIGGFANWLSEQGHACVVAVPGNKESLSAVHQPRFIAATYAEVLARPAFFPDNRPADLIHAWTPREGVRKFVLAYQRLLPGTRLIVHLEDNEEYLLSAFSGRPLADLRQLADDELAAQMDEALPHPLRYKNFLRLADGITIIVDRLKEFASPGVPVQLLPPGVDFSLYHPQPPSADLRRDLDLKATERVVVFTGSTTFANEAEIAELVAAVRLLNERGTPTRLVRTGFHPPEFTGKYGFDWRAFTLDLGFLDKTRLPALLALADVLVQPGRAGIFNDYRLPSKLPEFLAAGRPVILPATNVATDLRDGTDALLLRTGTAEEIAAQCQRVFADASLAARLGENAAAFARRHFDLAANTGALLGFYESVAAAPSRGDWAGLAAVSVTETALIPVRLRREITALLPADTPPRAALLSALDDLALSIARLEELSARGLARELQDKLEQEIQRLLTRVDLTKQHAANLKAELEENRKNLAALKTWSDQRISELEGRTQQLEATASALRHLVYNFQAELVRASTAADGERRRLEEIIATRDNKIRRMQESFSWQATAPLRALRRQFVKPAPPTQTVVPILPAESGPNPLAPKYQIDEPYFWHVPAGPISIRGWCLLPDGTTPSAIRARIGQREFLGTTGLPRPDVAAVHGSAASVCGFLVELVLESGRHSLVLEVGGQDGTWLCLQQTTLTVFAPAKPPVVESYETWIHLYEPNTPPALQALRERIAALPSRPLISVLMPVYNTPAKWLQRAVESVRGQIYGNWELCIADDASTAPHIRPLLESFAAVDPRIKVVFRPVNGHISAASNSALELATGEFVALLDHDDELPARALARVAETIITHPEAAFFFTDEDKITESGRRFDPYFKPDYLPDLFLGQNCLSHLSVIRTDLMRKVGGFRVGLEGSQDWDLALRVLENISADQVCHIPEVLYHWRAIEGSTAVAVGEKDYSVTAARRALSEHFTRQGLTVKLEPVPGHHWRVVHPIPEPAPLVSLIIPTRDRLELVRTCVDSILTKTAYPRYEILIIDNESTDPATLAWFAEIQRADPRVKVVPFHQPFNYSALNNFGVRHAAGAVVGLLNNDLEVINADWLAEMVAHALRPEIGAVGAMLYYPDGTIQHAGIILGLGGVANHAFYRYPRDTDGYKNRARLAQNFSAVTGACLVIRREIFEKVGGLNEQELAVAFNDVDFCLKVRAAGYRNLWTPFAELIHHESASRGTEDTPEKQARFAREVAYMQRTWGRELASDPAYNPNFSLDIEGFKLARPPRKSANEPGT
jgi:GT2 family glycosyltransferase/glycosyltransferase involved in cell wall biosynthesis